MRIRAWLILAIVLGVFSTVVSASEAPSEAYCKPMREARDWPLKKIAEDENRISFLNLTEKRMGIVGICWWHSRLQRNAIYLADFRPDLPVPSDREKIHLLRLILRGHRFVTVPGYANLHDFTSRNANLLSEEIVHFRNRSLLLKFEWTKKVFRPLHLSDERMVKEMAETREILVRGDIPYWMLQLDDRGAHSWLITELDPDGKPRLAVETIDSNYRQPKSWSHSETKKKYEDGQNFFGVFYVPFNDRRGELKRIRRIAESKCRIHADYANDESSIGDETASTDDEDELADLVTAD